MDLKWFYDIFACPMCTKFITSLKVYANFSIALFSKGEIGQKQYGSQNINNFETFSVSARCGVVVVVKATDLLIVARLK